MQTIETHYPTLTELAERLNKANVKGSKPYLTALPKSPTTETWEAHKLIAKSAAKFQYDKMICADLLDLQYKFYRYANLGDITEELVAQHRDQEEDFKHVL